MKCTDDVVSSYIPCIESLFYKSRMKTRATLEHYCDVGGDRRWDAFVRLSEDLRGHTRTFLQATQLFPLVREGVARQAGIQSFHVGLRSERVLDKHVGLIYCGKGQVLNSSVSQSDELRLGGLSSGPSVLAGFGSGKVASLRESLQLVTQPLEELVSSLAACIIDNYQIELALLGVDVGYLERFLKQGMQSLSLPEALTILEKRGKPCTGGVLDREARRELSAHLGNMPFFVIYEPEWLSLPPAQGWLNRSRFRRARTFAFADLVFPKIGIGCLAGSSCIRRRSFLNLSRPEETGMQSQQDIGRFLAVSFDHLLGFLLQTKLFFSTSAMSGAVSATSRLEA
jgi:hypothetical protein